MRYKRLLKGAAAAGVEVQIDPSEIEKKVRGSFHWQQFLSKGILKKHAQNFIDASAKSNLPFMTYEIARITDRRDPFARRIFLTSLGDHRTRVNEQEFLFSRAYFFGVFIRYAHSDEAKFQMYPCLLTNKKGTLCRHPCDPFGHHCFCCKTTTKTSDHNHARDIICDMSQALGFISHKEVVVFSLDKETGRRAG